VCAIQRCQNRATYRWQSQSISLQILGVLCERSLVKRSLVFAWHRRVAFCKCVVMAEQQDRRSWIETGVEAWGFRRGDGKWLLKLPSEHVELWGPLIERAGAALAAPLVVNTTGIDQCQRVVLSTAGFSARRIEALWRIPVAALSGRAVEATFHRLVPLDRCDLPRVVELDNVVRAGIPGSESWHGTLDDLLASTADDEFDPTLYLIAEHTTTGSYDGLIRVWKRVPAPRIGCVGVRASWRRTRLPAALLSTAAQVLKQQGVTEVIAETDLHNAGSHEMAAKRGTSRGEMTEWERSARI